MKLIDVTRQFNTEDKCFDYLERLRWPSGVCCIECGSVKVSRITRETKGKNKRARLYQCLEKECGHQFSATAGTIFHDSHLPLQTWFMAIALICEAKKSVSACQMQRHLGLGSYRTAWHLCHRIREAMKQDNVILNAPEIEVDDTYIGSRTKRPFFARRRTKKDDVVLGMVERNGGRLKLIPVADTKAKILREPLEKHISGNVATIYSDGHPIYVFALNKKFRGKQKTIDHNKAYAIGTTHTNHIESAFSLFKKGLYGSFHHVSKKHLARYCDEFSYRFSRRNQQSELFAQTTKSLLDGKRLPYATLTASQVSES